MTSLAHLGVNLGQAFVSDLVKDSLGLELLDNLLDDRVGIGRSSRRRRGRRIVQIPSRRRRRQRGRGRRGRQIGHDREGWSSSRKVIAGEVPSKTLQDSRQRTPFYVSIFSSFNRESLLICSLSSSLAKQASKQATSQASSSSKLMCIIKKKLPLFCKDQH